jgi:type IV pilus assembly protein PilP
MCIATALVVGLAGCSRGAELADLKAFVSELDDKHKGHVEPLPRLKPYESFTYNAVELREPFQPPETPQLAEREAEPAAPGIRPIQDRPREHLEQFPLDSLRMVGTLEQHQVPWALIKASDGAVYRVREGNYLGQNHGRIVDISEARVEVTELFPNGKGGWEERLAAIELSELSGGKKR